MTWPNLKVWLAAHGLSQAHFARSLGLKPNRFAQYMSGSRRMPLEIAVRVVEATGIPIQSLVVDEDRTGTKAVDETAAEVTR